MRMEDVEEEKEKEEKKLLKLIWRDDWMSGSDERDEREEECF